MRRTAMWRAAFFAGSIFLLMTVAAVAQENRSEISVQGTGFFTQGSSGNGTAYSTTGTGGFLGTYRYHLNHWISAEAAYGYDLNSQKYSLSAGGFRIQSGIHQATGSLVFNLPSRASSRLILPDREKYLPKAGANAACASNWSEVRPCGLWHEAEEQPGTVRQCQFLIAGVVELHHFGELFKHLDDV